MTQIEEFQRKMQAEAAQGERRTTAMRAAERGAADAQYSKLAQAHPELCARRDAARQALDAAAGDLQDAQHRAQQHAAAPPQSRDDVSAWARRRTDLAGEVEALTHLHEQARAAHEQAEQTLRGTLAGEVRHQFFATARELNAVRSQVIREYHERLQQLEAWGKEQLGALTQREQEELFPLVLVGREVLGVALPTERDMNGLFRAVID